MVHGHHGATFRRAGGHLTGIRSHALALLGVVALPAGCGDDAAEPTDDNGAEDTADDQVDDPAEEELAGMTSGGSVPAAEGNVDLESDVSC